MANQSRPIVKGFTLLALIALAWLAAVPVGALQADSEPPRDAIILLDVTRSMRGEGPPPVTDDIWGDVQARVIELISQLSSDTTVAIVPFDAGPVLPEIWPVPNAIRTDPIQFQSLEGDNRVNTISHINQLVPDGQATWICDALEFALEHLNVRRAELGDGRIQTIYLYTDGDDTGDCAENFPVQLAETFNARAGDYPFLHTIYMDLAGTLDPADQAIIQDSTNGHVDISDGLPANLQIQNESINLGNMAEKTEGQSVTVALRSELPNDGQSRTASVRVIGAAPGLNVEPATIALAPQMQFTIRTNGEFPEGSHSAVLQFAPLEGSFVLSNGGSVPLTFSWTPPAPTATPTNTPTATPTNTPTPTITPTPTPTVTPTSTPVPTPTATPVPIISIESLGGDDLGTIVAGSNSPLTGERELRVDVDPAEMRDATALEVVVTLDGQEDPEQFWVVAPDGNRASRATFEPTVETLILGYRINAASESQFLPGSDTRHATVTIANPNAGGNGSGDSGTSVETIYQANYGYQISQPWELRHFIFLLLLAATALFILYVALHPRFPEDAYIQVIGGGSYPLRATAERGIIGRLFRQTISIGDDIGPKSIDVGTFSRVARLTPGHSRFSIRSRDTILHPDKSGEHPLQLSDHFESINGPTRLTHDTTIRIQSGRDMTFQDYQEDTAENYDF